MTDSNLDPAKEWAIDFLQDRGCHVRGQFIPVRIMPWSSVYRIDTSVGVIYLKQIAPPFIIEASLLLHLGCSFPERVPEVVGHNDDLCCFLMFDAGTPLRERLLVNYELNLTKSALESYASIQHGMIEEIDTLFACGVPDWRLTALPSLYLQLVENSTFLKAEGLTDSELKSLRKLQSSVSKWCKQLKQYEIPDTIEHGDFQDNNVLVNSNSELVISDWGDAVVTHPFFSLSIFLHSAARQHSISQTHPFYTMLVDYYLTTWLEYESKPKLLEAFNLAEKLSPIKFSLSFYRVSQCPGMHGLGEYQGIIADALRQFLKLNTQ